MPPLLIPADPDSNEPDGYVVLHTPEGETEPLYAIGPFPPMPELVALIVASTSCACAKTSLPIAFPKGIAMAVDMTDMLPPEVLEGVRMAARAKGVVPGSMLGDAIGLEETDKPVIH